MLKYKVWDLKNKCWLNLGEDEPKTHTGEVGFYVLMRMDAEFSSEFGLYRFYNNTDHEDNQWSFTLVEDVEIVRYIEHKDQHGRELYEGDIINDTDRGSSRLILHGKRTFLIIKPGSDFPDWHCPTGFIAESLDFVPSRRGDDEMVHTRDMINSAYTKHYKFVGTKFENPELLDERG